VCVGAEVLRLLGGSLRRCVSRGAVVWGRGAPSLDAEGLSQSGYVAPAAGGGVFSPGRLSDERRQLRATRELEQSEQRALKDVLPPSLHASLKEQIEVAAREASERASLVTARDAERPSSHSPLRPSFPSPDRESVGHHGVTSFGSADETISRSFIAGRRVAEAARHEGYRGYVLNLAAGTITHPTHSSLAPEEEDSDGLDALPASQLPPSQPEAVGGEEGNDGPSVSTLPEEVLRRLAPRMYALVDEAAAEAQGSAASLGLSLPELAGRAREWLTVGEGLPADAELSARLQRRSAEFVREFQDLASRVTEYHQSRMSKATNSAEMDTIDADHRRFHANAQTVRSVLETRLRIAHTAIEYAQVKNASHA
jgi:hypothetical protein